MEAEPVKLPPQVLKQQVRSIAANQDMNSLRDGAALQAFGNRLPVLQAFQEFLEIERRQTRRRMRAMALTFLGVLVAIILIGVGLFFAFAGRMNADMRRLETALAVARDESGALRGDTQAIQRALDEARAALSSLQARMEQNVANRNAAPAVDFSALAGALATLQSLQRADANVAALTARMAALAREVDRVMAERARLIPREERVAQAHAELAQAISALFSEQDAIESGIGDLAAVGQSSTAAPLSRRGSLKGSGVTTPAASAASVPARAVSLLDELSELRFKQQSLLANFGELDSELHAIEQEREQLGRQMIELRVAGSDLLRDAQQALARQDVVSAYPAE